MPGDVVLGDEEGLLFLPPHLVQAALDAAASIQARDEWNNRKMDRRKELDDYINAHPPKQ